MTGIFFDDIDDRSTCLRTWSWPFLLKLAFYFSALVFLGTFASLGKVTVLMLDLLVAILLRDEASSSLDFLIEPCLLLRSDSVNFKRLSSKGTLPLF